jgi:predicted NAD-dependent protein-ADP-ribosyltransferase YbiA (DUF1768 family)
LATIEPRDVKKLGRKIKLRADWDHVVYRSMFNVQVAKYKNPELKALLIATEYAYLEETNNWGDTFWGVYNGIGDDNLGKIIMCCRQSLLAEELNKLRVKP